MGQSGKYAIWALRRAFGAMAKMRYVKTHGASLLVRVGDGVRGFYTLQTFGDSELDFKS